MTQGFTVYITAQTICGELSDASGQFRAVAQLKAAGFTRAIIEAYRGGLVVPEERLRDLRDYFHSEGFHTLGGLMPVHGPGFGKVGEGAELRCPFFCYTAEETVGGLETEIRKLSRLFDQVVIDDAFLTGCRCETCDEARAGRAWGEFRRDLLARVAQRWVRAAHEENPGVRLTVKFPQYYDRYHRFGYDTETFPGIFDLVWVGTETRDPRTPDYGFVEPYEGYFNVRWMRTCAGDKLEAAWFDYLDCDEQLFYDQAVATHLAAPREITVFCYSHDLFAGPKIRRLASAPALAELRRAAETPEGVAVYKPKNSDGGRDLFIFDYLGMIGVPCVPVTELRPNLRSVLIPAHGAHDPQPILDLLDAGAGVILTADALRRLAGHAELLQRFGYRPKGVGLVGTAVRSFEVNGLRLESAGPVRLAADLAPSDADVPAWGIVQGVEAGAIRVPFVTQKAQSSGGRAIVWNLGTFGHDDFLVEESLNAPVETDWFRLPRGVLDFLRATATAPLGWTLETPARVASFVFSGHAAFVNYNTHAVDVHVHGLPWQPESLRSDSPGAACLDGLLHLPAHGYGLLRRA